MSAPGDIPQRPRRYTLYDNPVPPALSDDQVRLVEPSYPRDSNGASYNPSPLNPNTHNDSQQPRRLRGTSSINGSGTSFTSGAQHVDSNSSSHESSLGSIRDRTMSTEKEQLQNASSGNVGRGLGPYPV